QGEGDERGQEPLSALPEPAEPGGPGLLRLRQIRCGLYAFSESVRSGHATTSFESCTAAVGTTRAGPWGFFRPSTSERMRSDCSSTRAMMTTALNAGVAAEGTPRNTTVLFSVAMSSAPNVDPMIENLPPASEVPPMTTAKMASISSRFAVLEGLTVMTSETLRTPAS